MMSDCVPADSAGVLERLPGFRTGFRQPRPGPHFCRRPILSVNAPVTCQELDGFLAFVRDVHLGRPMQTVFIGRSAPP